MKRSRKTKRRVGIDVEFYGSGAVVQKGAGWFSGGVVPPKVLKNVKFLIHREIPDENGLLGPVGNEAGVDGAFQVNIYANSKGYRELAKYLLALAELDASEDQGFHEHHDDVRSADGRTRLDIICRKKDDLDEVP